MRNPLTTAAGWCKMFATLGRVGGTREYGASWYNEHCTQRPPHARVCVTLPRGTDAVRGAVCVFATNEKARRVEGLAAITLRTS
jgi:hypothetical protein